MTDAQYVRLCVELERAGHDGSASLAARFVSDFRRLNGVDPGLIVYDEFDAAAALARSFSTMKILESDPDRANDTIDAMAAGFDRAVMNAGRDTVEWSAGAQGRSWRRVTDGDPCAFVPCLPRGRIIRPKKGHSLLVILGVISVVVSVRLVRSIMIIVVVRWLRLLALGNRIGLMPSIRGRMRRLVSGLMIMGCSSRLAIF